MFPCRGTTEKAGSLQCNKYRLGRIIALDYGRKRTGIAVTDPLQMIANSVATVPSSELIAYLVSYAMKESVDAFVIGYPRQMNNSPSEAVMYINPFIDLLKKTFPDKEVFLMDERFTSKLAGQAMVMGGVKKKKRQDKALVDAISATIILQSFLEQRENRKLNDLKKT
jgi:putative Holliday junction resolvase